MADQKITALTGWTTPILTDELSIVDVTAVATKKIHYADLIGNIPAPQGFLINGKIVPSVASNDLTVAIKGIDGNDPSASNPVYCRIGDTVRKISAALSVTKLEATNWFNAGGAELATKEIDYFVYLGYNATDGVVVGFARIPYVCQYDGFSATSTNEKYCAISTITNAAAGDYYEVIGRFAATLSAGAGYTWTVPTFTTVNLIQRPIYETRWLTWVPAYSASGSMTYTSVTASIAQYKVTDGKCFIQHRSTGTTGGTANTELRFSLPFSPTATPTYVCNVVDTAFIPGTVYNISTNVLACSKYDNSNFGLAGSKRADINTFFEII